MATGSSDHPSSKTEVLQYQLESFIENLRTIGVIAGDFQQHGQNNFNEKLNGAIENMRQLDRLKDEYSDLHVPLAVLEYVDEGRNPELFTRHQLERTLSDHIGIQKKVQAYKDFREQLIRQLEPVFPEEIQAYVAVSEFSKKEQR
ncbi:mediator of RNA polymerase II transcription subunit 10-like [Halichondria panicea]|uniref:mediator of RNA polymerase II transcription subunit 10-like n=1 Tax=Halichondria panicea TaxID=6063 RepID=UPI00312BC483